MTHRRTLLFACLLAMTAGGAGAQAPADAPARKLATVETFSILADLVHNVGGDMVEVQPLVGPGGDAHVYVPSPLDARKLAAADVVFINGLRFTGWMDRLVASSGTKARIIMATKGIKPLEWNLPGAEGKHRTDPHAWQSIPNAKIYVANIRDGLIAADPARAASYAANAEAYTAKLEQLDADVRQAIASIPPGNRKIITTHDAFGYFGATYGLSFIAPVGISTESEPSARDIARIIRQIRAEKIPAVFLENVSDPRLSQRIAAETGAKIGGTLYSDGLSPPGGPAGTYIDMVRHNIKELTAALAK